MAKKKTIKLRYGKIKELANISGVSEKSVQRALNFESDTDSGREKRDGTSNMTRWWTIWSSLP